MRLTQGMIGRNDGRLCCFVDDPLVALLGDQQQVDDNVVSIIAFWQVLGLPLAFHKGQRGERVVWTSSLLSFQQGSIIAAVKPDLLQDTWELLLEALGRNLLSKKLLRKLLGKLSHIASLVYFLRPFLTPLWGSLAYQGATNAPAGFVWTKQCHDALHWIRVWLSDKRETLHREVSVLQYHSPDTDVLICSDASPFGYGAVLCLQGVIV
eukprot:5266593-Amphidinium_carterae.1